MLAGRARHALPMLSLVAALAGCRSDAAVDGPAAGVVVPCPGTSDPMPAGLQCGLVCRASLPVRASDSRLFLIDVQVDGKPALMALDTGADRTALSPLAAARLGLPPATLMPERFFTIGGSSQVSSTAMQSVAFGHVRVGPGPIDILPSSQGAAGTGELGFDGVLGGDILRRYQLDLDFSHQRIRLYEGTRCPGPLPGWPAEVAAVPFTTRPDSHMVGVSATLNGIPLKALLDTGMEASVVWQTGARELKVAPDDLAHDPPIELLGIGPGGMSARLHRFLTLSLGAAVVPDAAVAVGADRSEGPLMIVGDNVLATRRVWIDYVARQVHFARAD